MIEKMFLLVLLSISSLDMLGRQTLTERKLIKIDQKHYVSATEVSNTEYRKFLNHLLETQQSEKYIQCLYDSLQWQSPNTYNQPLVEYYHRHAVYQQYPVVNLTKMAMEYYCQWLTEQYHQSSKRKYTKVNFRLPTENEYKIMMKDESPSLEKQSNKRSAQNPNDMMITAPVYAYSPTHNGIFNLFGNVSEVTYEGSIVGENFTTTNKGSAPSVLQQYQLPDSRVGFRWVMEIIDY